MYKQYWSYCHCTLCCKAWDSCASVHWHPAKTDWTLYGCVAWLQESVFHLFLAGSWSWQRFDLSFALRSLHTRCFCGYSYGSPRIKQIFWILGRGPHFDSIHTPFSFYFFSTQPVKPFTSPAGLSGLQVTSSLWGWFCSSILLGGLEQFYLSQWYALPLGSPCCLRVCRICFQSRLKSGHQISHRQ